MKQKSVPAGRIDEHGRLILPDEVVRRHGLKPGSTLPIIENEHSLLLRRPVSHLAKVYIEPTSHCNLTCRTCIRNSWDEPMGSMAEATFERILDGLRAFDPPLTVMFGGFGEPLFHPAIASMVARVKRVGAQVELITNGTLLTGDLSLALAEAGIDVLWVSLDGSTAESFSGVRPDAALNEVVENAMRFRSLSWKLNQGLPHMGIVFVAMRRNIAELPEVIKLGRKILADRFLITNVLPYTEELCGEVLYDSVLINVPRQPSSFLPQLILSKIDSTDITREPLYRISREWQGAQGNPMVAGNSGNYCPFIEKGSTAICWDGSVSPCLPLLHSHTSYLNERIRRSRRYVVGTINERGLNELWLQPEYVAFRERVQSFPFSPCTFCGGCELSETNEEDCTGNVFPTCGGCLWAQGVIQCP